MRVPFSQVFRRNADGSYSPTTVVKVGPVQMGPGVAFGQGVSFGGLDVASIAGKDLDVEQNADGSYTVTGYFQ